jgi:DNA-binding MarR family transcriptional regulator
VSDPDELAAQFRVAIVPLVRSMRRHIHGGLTPTLLSALGTVGREGPITMSDLAAAENVTPAMATKLATGLTDRDLVTRVSSIDDRRVVLLEVTAAGRQLVLDTQNLRNAWLAERLAGLSEAERVQLAGAIAVIERMTRRSPTTA